MKSEIFILIRSMLHRLDMKTNNDNEPTIDWQKCFIYQDVKKKAGKTENLRPSSGLDTLISNMPIFASIDQVHPHLLWIKSLGNDTTNAATQLSSILKNEDAKHHNSCTATYSQNMLVRAQNR